MNEKDNLDYNAFLETKKAQRIDSGFDVEESQLNPQLFPFQRYCVRRALRNGKFALFEDCGLGKSIQQLEWAKQVIGRINKPVLILAPLAVVGQTIKEGIKFGYIVWGWCRSTSQLVWCILKQVDDKLLCLSLESFQDG